MRAFCRLGFGFSFRASPLIELNVCAATSLGVVAVTRGRVSNADLVWLAEGAFDVLLTHAGDHTLIDDRFATLPGIEQVSTLVFLLADHDRFSPRGFHTGCVARFGFRHECRDAAWRKGADILLRKVFSIRATQRREGNASVDGFAAVNGRSERQGWRAEQGEQ
ncbi:hypothetical protein D3C84_783300 [compost metagenome]